MANNRKHINTKLKTVEELAAIVSGLKARGLKVVHCHGVFDLIHPGHIRHLEAAKREGDVLMVSITPDEYVNKGPGRPVFDHFLRAESLAGLDSVDYVAINKWPTAVETILEIKPNVYVKGSEYADRDGDITGKIYDEEKAVLSVGGEIHFTDEITFSSSHLINNYLSVYPPETEQWLRQFRRQHSVDEVLGYFEKAADLKVLVVGEAIIDEYVFCDGLGKSTKDPILAFAYRSCEAYAGGSLAIANHVASFCNNVGLVTLLGETETRDDFIRESLMPNVTPSFVTWTGAPTIHKRRFVDNHTNARMFEIYVIDDTPLSAADDAALTGKLEEVLEEYDLVVVADYGHGMFTPAVVKSLCDNAGFLCVNTQANAGNRGFNTISKYSRADYVCLAEHEVALETRMRFHDLEERILEVTKRIDCPRFTVTYGKHGSMHYTPERGFVSAPALATRVVDRVGAGDSLFALTSLLVRQDAPWDVVGLLGNVAGAHMVDELGNKTSINKTAMAKTVLSLMK